MLQLQRQHKSYFGKEPPCCQGFRRPKLKEDALRKGVRVGENREELAQSKTSHPEGGEILTPSQRYRFAARGEQRLAVKMLPWLWEGGCN